MKKRRILKRSQERKSISKATEFHSRAKKGNAQSSKSSQRATTPKAAHVPDEGSVREKRFTRGGGFWRGV